ncbi:hypothetical protein ACQY0O_005675 [Thecaphora frezii]
MEPALGAPFGADGDEELRKRVQNLFSDYAKGSETVLVRDLPTMIQEFERIQGYSFFQPQDLSRVLEFAHENGDLPVRSDDLVNFVVNHEAARSPSIEQQPDVDSSSSDDGAEPGTVFKGRAVGSPSFSRPLPPRLRGRHSSAGERSTRGSNHSSPIDAYISSPLSRSRENSASPSAADDGLRYQLADSLERIARLEESLAEQSQTVDSLKQQLREEEHKIGGLERELAERASKLDELNEQLAEREQRLGKFHDLEDSYEARMVELQEHSDELTLQLKDSARENKELRTKSQFRQTYIDRLEAEVSQLQSKSAEDEALHRKLRTEYDTLKKEHSQLQKDREEQCNATERIRQQLLKETERVERKQEEVDRLAFQVKEAKDDMDRANRKIADLEDRLEPLEDALVESQSANADLQGMIEQLRENDDAESISSRHRRLSSEMGDVSTDTSVDLDPFDEGSERSTTPPVPASEPDVDADSDVEGSIAGDAEHLGDSQRDDARPSTGAERAEADGGGSTEALDRVPFPTTPNLEEVVPHPTEALEAITTQPASLGATANPTAFVPAEDTEVGATVPSTPATAAAEVADESEGEDYQTTPTMHPMAMGDAVAALNLAAAPSASSQHELASLRQRIAAPGALIANGRALLANTKTLITRPQSVLGKLPMLDRSLLRRSEVYLFLLTIVLGVVLGHLLAPRSRFASAWTREETLAYHKANTMWMPYPFAPDFGEDGLFSPAAPHRSWFSRLLGRKATSDFFIPT